MAALGVTTPPVFSVLDCGVEGFKVSINLDLSFGNESSMTLIEGKPFPSKTVAENSAVMIAFRHLEEKSMIKVLDFSSRVSMSFSVYNTYSHVYEAIDSVLEVLAKFETTFGKCKDLAMELEGLGLEKKCWRSFWKGTII